MQHILQHHQPGDPSQTVSIQYKPMHLSSLKADFSTLYRQRPFTLSPTYV